MLSEHGTWNDLGYACEIGQRPVYIVLYRNWHSAMPNTAAMCEVRERLINCERVLMPPKPCGNPSLGLKCIERLYEMGVRRIATAIFIGLAYGRECGKWLMVRQQDSAPTKLANPVAMPRHLFVFEVRDYIVDR